MKLRHALLASLLTLPIASSVAYGAAFTNGGFESPGTATVGLVNNDALVTGWIHTGNSGSEFYAAAFGFGINAGEGVRYIVWGGNGNTGGTLSQTFDTLIGTTYNVNYLLSRQQIGANNLQVALVQALNGNAVLNGVTNNIIDTAAGVWYAGLTLTFQAASTSTTLRFTDQTNVAVEAGALNWGLDGVTVDAVAPTGGGVPEPATYGLIGLGLGMLAIFRKKR